jgi:putative zinc finger/helix-turn-helix YgiT family protein
MSTELLPNVRCPICGVTGKVARITRHETVRVRDIDVSVNRVLRKCAACGEEFENTLDHDWKIDAYAEYRKARGFCTPDEVRAWRVQYGLTQDEVSQLLSWGEATLGRYENGALPTDSQHRQLVGLMQPQGLAQALDDCPGAVSDEKRMDIMGKLRDALRKVRAQQMLTSIAGCFVADEFTGNRGFNVWRAAALVSVLARAGEFKTKLNKLLFYADFAAFREQRSSISGFRYARIAYGPVPSNYEGIYAAMELMEVIQVEPRENKGYAGEVITSTQAMPTDMLSPKELHIAERVREHFSGWTATRTKNFSHRERAWKEVGSGDLIPYEFANSLQLKI